MDTKNYCYFCNPAWEHICRVAGFTDREGEVFRRISRRLKVHTIARELGIEPSTVQEHVERAYRRLDMHNREEMAVFSLNAKSRII